MTDMKLSKNETPELNITIPEQVNISIGANGGTKDHSKLKNLGFDESGHTGFQRELTFDESPTAGSENPVTSGGVKAALDEKVNVKILTNGGATSVNGGSVFVSIYSIGVGDLASLYFGSKVGEPETGADSLEVPSYGLITALLGEKQDKLTFDTTPTIGSSNPVTSDGIRAELDTKASTGALADLDSDKADISDVISLQETVTQLGSQIDAKANSSDVYTKSEIDSMIGDIEDAADGIIALQESYIGGNGV